MYQRLPVNEYGQPLHPPGFYDPGIPGWIEEQCISNKLTAACYEAFDDYCEKWCQDRYRCVYEDFPDFDDFKDEWFQDYAQSMVEAESDDDFGYDSEYWTAFVKYLAKELQNDDSVTATGFMPYFNQWYKHGFYKAA